MRTFIISLLVLAGTASAQDSLYFKFGRHIIAEWGASKGAVMALAKDAGLEFVEIDNIPENKILHITYRDKTTLGMSIQRMFTLFNGRYVGHTWVITADIARRNKILSKHQEYCMQIGEPSDEANKFDVQMGETLYQVTTKNNTQSAFMMLVNINEIARSQE